MLIRVVTSFVTAIVVFIVFSSKHVALCAYTMKTIPAIKTDRSDKKDGDSFESASTTDVSILRPSRGANREDYHVSDFPHASTHNWLDHGGEGQLQPDKHTAGDNIARRYSSFLEGLGTWKALTVPSRLGFALGH